MFGVNGGYIGWTISIKRCVVGHLKIQLWWRCEVGGLIKNRHRRKRKVSAGTQPKNSTNNHKKITAESKFHKRAGILPTVQTFSKLQEEENIAYMYIYR